MKLIWHIVRKDLRRMAAPLALWSLLRIAQGELGVSLLLGDARDWGRFDAFGIISGILHALDLFAALILVALLVQDDALMGARSFWMTRPISGARLLVAKLLGALIMFGALPILLSLRWWLACGYGLPEIGHATLVTLDRQMLVVLIGFAVAALTPTMPRFLLGLLFLAIALIAGAGLLARREEFVTPDGFETRAAINAGFLALGALVAIVVQFTTRQRRWALLSIALGYTATLATGVWHWSGASRGSEAAEAKELRLAAINGKWIGRDVWVGFRLDGVPATAGLVAEGRVTSPTPRHGGGFTLASVQNDFGIWQAAGLLPEAFHQAERETSSRTSSAHVVGSEGAREWAEPGGATNFAADMEVRLIHAVRDARLPVRAGADVTSHGCRVRVAGVDAREGKVHALIVESRPTWTYFPHQGLSALWGDLEFDADLPRYFLVNAARNQIREQGTADMAPAVFGTQAVRWLTLTFDAAEITDDAMLALIRLERGAPFLRHVENPNLPMTLLRSEE